MPHLYPARLIILLLSAGILAACSGGTTSYGLGVYDPGGTVESTDPLRVAKEDARTGHTVAENQFVPAGTEGAQAAAGSGSIWDNFTNASNPNVTVQVNKYLWKAALEVLDFLPVESVDPFTGVIVTGYGTPPGSSRSYRATIFVQDGALDARSLNVALQTKGGTPVDEDTARAVEDAILNRARELRIADAGY
jgi:hypothetical protein